MCWLSHGGKQVHGLQHAAGDVVRPNYAPHGGGPSSAETWGAKVAKAVVQA